MKHRQLILNFVAYVVFVGLKISVITMHACELKSSGLEAGLFVLTVAIIPLVVFTSRSLKGLFWKVILCVIATMAIDSANGSWLHSDFFPKEWLDLREQEFLKQMEEHRLQPMETK